MKWKKLRALRYLKNPKRIPHHIKKADDGHPQRKGIEFWTKKQIIDKVDYGPIEKALQKAIDKKRLGRINKRVLGNLVARLQRGTGYTDRTRKAFDEELPLVIERACQNKQTEKDVQDLKDLQEWLEWHKGQETTRIVLGGK